MRTKALYNRPVFRTLETLRRHSIKQYDITWVASGKDQWTIKEFINKAYLDENTLNQMHMRGENDNFILTINFYGYSKEDGWKTFEMVETRLSNSQRLEKVFNPKYQRA